MAGSQVSRLGTSPEEGVKAPCVVSTTANITLSGEQTIESVDVVAGDRVLVRFQTDDTENGIYDAAAGEWTRATDFNQANDVVNGVMVLDASTKSIYQAEFTGEYEAGVTSVTFPSTAITPDASSISYNDGNDDIIDAGNVQDAMGQLDDSLYEVVRVRHEIVTDMVAATSLELGDFVTTTGHNESGDGGDNTYEIVANTGQTIDGGAYILLDNGMIAAGLFPRRNYTFAQWGAVGDGVADDTSALQACLDYFKHVGLDPTVQGNLNGISPIEIGLIGKSYLISSKLDFDEMYYVTFVNGEFLADSGAVWGSDAMLSLAAPQGTDVVREQRIRNIAFKGIKVNGTQSADTCVYLENTFKVSFDADCFITGWANNGTGIKGSNVNATPKTKNTHFTMIGTELAQKELSYLQAGAGVSTSGTAVSLQTADFNLQSVTVWGCDVGFFFNGFANGQMNDCHSFVKGTQECMVVGDNCSGLQCSNFYSDTGIVTLKSFRHTFSGGSFAANSQVNLEAQVANETGKGLVIDGALFSNVLAFTTTGPGTWATDKELSLEGCRKLDNGNLIELAGTEHLGDGRLGIVADNDLRWIFENDAANSFVPATNNVNILGSATKLIRGIYVSFINLTADNVQIAKGSGTPEGNYTANRGSLYLRLDGGAGTTLYVKESAGINNTGWVAK